MTDVFTFLQGEKIRFSFEELGGGTEPCEVIEDDGGDKVLVKYQVYGQGPFYTEPINRSLMRWYVGTETSKRFHAWKTEQAQKTSS